MTLRRAAAALLNAASAASMASTLATTARTRMPSPRMMGAADALGGPEIAVLGGGFGGLYTALRLSSLDWSGGPTPRITLVDRSDRFSFSPMLYELATGTATSWEVAPRYEDLLSDTPVEFVRGEVSGLDEESNVVTIATSQGAERQLPYDWCVLAFGLQPQTSLVPGVAEHARTFYTAEDALGLKECLRALEQERTVDEGTPLRIGVVGGGYVGVELAANLASVLSSPTSVPARDAQITLVHRSEALLPAAQRFSREEAQNRLLDAGVELLLSTAVRQVAAGELTLAPSAPADAPSYSLPVDLTIWTAGTEAAPVVASLGLPLDAAGRLDADATLRVRGHERLFALGDGASIVDVRQVTAPATAQAAMQQADYVAWNVRAAARSEPTLPFRYENLGEMLSLGPESASVAALAEAVRLRGPLAVAARRAVYAARMPTPSQAAKVGLSWAIDTGFSVLRKVAEAQKKP
mmetsp:Transcript_11338/g.28978  ORF Transcript_11338/g.28978 Transcript_11338/m.28978 type:complete len:467 (+) Transcript_11338:62-1462(+)